MRDKNKTHFEWVLRHWFSLCQGNLEPTQPNSVVVCKVATASPCEDQCQWKNPYPWVFMPPPFRARAIIFSGCPSVRLSILRGFPGIFMKMHGRNGLQFSVLMYPDYLQNMILLLIICWFSASCCSLTSWNWWYFGFPCIVWRTCGSKHQGGVKAFRCFAWSFVQLLYNTTN